MTRSEAIAAYERTDEWKQKAREAKRRANWRCERCGRGDVPLETHHIHYRNLGHEFPEDLRALCGDCHDYFHGRRRESHGQLELPLPRT